MNPRDFLNSIDRQEKERAVAQQMKATETQQKTDALEDAKMYKTMTAFLRYKPSVTVDNFPDSIKTPDVVQVVAALEKLEKGLKPTDQDNSDVVAAITELKAAVESLKPNAAYKPQVNVAAPQVTVKPPEVNVTVPKTDLKPLEKAIKESKPEAVDFKDVLKALKAVQKAVDSKVIPVANTPTDPLVYYLPADIDDAGTVQYFGYTDNKGAWYIRKYDTSVSPKTLRFAFGQSSYSTNFTNRASLTYSVWGS